MNKSFYWATIVSFLGLIAFTIYGCPKKRKYPISGKSKVGFVQLPFEGKGYYYFPGNDTYGADNWGKPSAIGYIAKIGKLWLKTHKKGPRIGIGDMSRRDGGAFRGHKGHRNGNETDVRLFRNDQKELPSNVKNTKEYNRKLTKEAILLFIKHCKIKVIYLNDPVLIKSIPKVKHYKGHENHFHVIFE